MAYTHTNSQGVTYYLHSRVTTLRGGRKQRIYYFAKTERAADAVDKLPDGYFVKENPRNSFPVLKKK